LFAWIDVCGTCWQEIGLVVRFRDRAALDAHIPHPAHRGVVEKHIHPIREEVIVVDYEI